MSNCRPDISLKNDGVRIRTQAVQAPESMFLATLLHCPQSIPKTEFLKEFIYKYLGVLTKCQALGKQW